MAQEPATSARTGGIPVLGAVARPRTYRSLALLLLLFPVGIANFAMLVTGLSLGFALTPLLIGVPILGLVLVAVTWLAAAYAGLLSAVSGRSVACEGFRFGPDGFWAGLKRVALAPRTWVLLVALFATFPLGLASFVAVVTVFAVGLALLLAPVAAPLPVTTYQVGPDWVLETPLELGAAAIVGAAVLVVGLWVVDLAGVALARAGAAVLEYEGDGEAATDADTDADDDSTA